MQFPIWEIPPHLVGSNWTWLTQSEHSKLQNVTKGVQRLDRKLVVFERPMGKDDPRRARSGFVAQPVNVFHSSQSCSWSRATEYRGIHADPTQSCLGASSAKSRGCARRAREAGTSFTHGTSSLIARYPAFRHAETLEICRQQSAFQRAHRIPDRVPNAIALPTTPSRSASANKGTTSMPSRERHALKQRTADRRSKHARTHIFKNA